VTSQKLSQLQNENDAAELRIKNALPKNVPLPPSTVSVGSSYAYESKKRRTCESGSGSGSAPGSGSGSAIEKAFNLKDREQLHFEIARMFYSGGYLLILQEILTMLALTYLLQIIIFLDICLPVIICYEPHNFKKRGQTLINYCNQLGAHGRKKG